MPETTHTPGPWTDHNDDGTIRIMARRSPSDGLAVVHDEDDARLIAAAPDLLEACREALDYVNGFHRRALLEGAIAKATGADR